MKQKKHNTKLKLKAKKIITKFEPGQIYYVALWDTYSNSKSMWVGEEDITEFMKDRIYIELVGWFYKEDNDFYFFYSMANRLEASCKKKEVIKEVNQVCYLTAVPKKAVIKIIKFAGGCFK